MYKLLFKFIVVILTTCFSLNIFAQDFFSSGENKKNAPPIPVYPPPNPVLTPDQFKDRVNTLRKQNTDAINQQISQQVSKPQAPLSQAPTAAPPPPSDFSSLNPQSSPSATGNYSSQPFGTTNGLPNPHPVAPGGQQQQKSPQSSTYTGFGTGTSTTNTGTSGGTSGGWSVKY